MMVLVGSKHYTISSFMKSITIFSLADVNIVIHLGNMSPVGKILNVNKPGRIFYLKTNIIV